jgi:phosphoribosylamine---glycine ligase
MDVLLIGSGGREHALAWKLRQSPRLGRLYAAPGNPGIARVAECVALDPSDHEAVARFSLDRNVGLVVVGPEAPLVAGLADSLRARGVRVFGPSAAAARLEGSKGFTKDLCAARGIPTAPFRRFAAPEPAKTYIREAGAPIVVKADGLAAGKGVTVAASEAEALAAVDACFAGSDAEVVVEAFLEGEEASVFCLCDGETAVPFGTAQDHKRAGDGDTGPNTGGMGAYSPAPVVDDAMLGRVMAEIVEPTIAAMREDGAPFSGVLFAGLMITADGPKLIEYNVRFGDPECQALMLRLEADLVDLMNAAVDGRLREARPAWTAKAALAVVVAARGYPGPVAKGSRIRGVAEAEAAGCMVFHAGTALEDGELVAEGGRVLSVCATGSTVAEAQAAAYRGVAALDWPEGFCRGDIGWRAVARGG